jgi:hypothetical protein
MGLSRAQELQTGYFYYHRRSNCILLKKEGKKQNIDRIELGFRPTLSGYSFKNG